MKNRLVIAFVLALAATPVCAQPRADATEISFWESVRETKNPAELRAYLQQYPNGVFKALAEARLATLENPAAQQRQPAAVAAPVQRAVAGQPRAPKAGDTWTYRLTYPRLRGKFGMPERAQAEHVVKAESVSAQEVVDVLAIDGGSGSNVLHGPGSYLVPEGMSIYSPYLFYFKPGANGRLGRVENRDQPCNGRYICTASGRVLGQEEVTVAAGRFLATKVVIEQEWRPQFLGAAAGTGGRTLTVWYVPELSRAVRYSSRETVGTSPPVDPSFDLELVSYKLN